MLAAMIEAPLNLHRETVRPDWIDYNGHMNVAYYVLAFDHATDAFLDHLGLDEGYRTRTNCSTFTLEGHVSYEREVADGAPIGFTTQLLDFDAKRIHYFLSMYHADEGFLAATCEWILMHMDMGERRSATFPPEVLSRLEAILESHATLPHPPQVGRVIGIRRKS